MMHGHRYIRLQSLHLTDLGRTELMTWRWRLWARSKHWYLFTLWRCAVSKRDGIPFNYITSRT